MKPKTKPMKNLNHYLCFLLLLAIPWQLSAQQQYVDGPINLQVKVREVKTLFNATDAQALGVGFNPDELTYKVWATDDAAISGLGWQGGQCLTANFDPIAAGTNSPDFNYTMFNRTYTTPAVPRFVDIYFEGWEDDSDDFSCQGNRCVFDPSVPCAFINTGDDFHCFTVNQPFKNNLDYRNGNPCEWYSHGFLDMDAGASANDVYKPRIETFWRYTKGTGCSPTAAIDLYTFSSGSAVTHFNSNVCYTNNFSNSPGNDVFYTFTTNAPIGAQISLCGGATFDSYLYLLDSNCNVISSNDNSCGSVSEITYPICNPGRYYVVVDATLATETGTFTLSIDEDPSVLVNFTSTSTPVTCNGGTDGAASVTVTSGRPPYTYTWSPGSFPNTSSLSNLTAGTYTVTVRDSFGCEKTENIVVAEPAPLVLSLVAANNPSCAGVTNGSIVTSATGGNAPYQYSIDFGNTFQNNATFGNLGVGFYDIMVRDSKGCTDTLLRINLINPPTSIRSNPTIVDVSCNGDADGSAAFSPYGGVSPYQFSLNGGAFSSTASFSNLAPGNYNLRIVDGIGCSMDTAFNIVQPVVLQSLIINQVDVLCNGGADGEFTIAANGGTPGYEYSLDSVTFTANGTFTGLAAGNYYVYVRDANNCTALNAVQINEPTPLTAAVQFQLEPTCNGSTDGVVVVAASGGTGPYQYSDDNVSFQSNAAYTNLSAGTYTYYIQDANLCNDSVIVTVTDPAAITATATITDASCAGSADGVLVVNATGGTAPYRYTINSGLFQSDSTFNNLAAGTYVVTVRDVNFCEDNFQFTVGNTSSIVATFSAVTQVACFGDATGAFTVTGSGGTAPYEYALNGGGYSSTNTFTGLTAATYDVSVRDAGGCIKDTTFTIVEPVDLVVTADVTNATCFNVSDGAIDLTVTGGAGNYVYSWSGGLPATQDQTGLAGGTYTVDVTDGNGCTESLTIVVDQSPEIFLSIANVTDVSCNGANDGGLDLSIAGGAPPFTYSWSNTSTNEDLTGVNGGTYTVTVTDANGCTTTAFGTVGEEQALSIAVNLDADVTCAAGADGTISAAVVGGVPPYQYSLNGGAYQIDSFFTGLVTGTYFIIAKDSKGCEISSSTVTLSELSSLDLSYEDLEITQGESGQLVADLFPTDAVLTDISWSPADGLSCTNCLEPIANPADTTEYTVTIVDENGCSVTTTVTVYVNDDFRAFIPNIFTPNGDGQNDFFSFYTFGAVRTSVKIFNRWGAQVYYNPNQPSATNGWDGQFSGEDAPEGTYVYVIEILFANDEERQFTGSVTLIR